MKEIIFQTVQSVPATWTPHHVSVIIYDVNLIVGKTGRLVICKLIHWTTNQVNMTELATLDHQIMQIPMQVDADPEVMKRFRLVLKLLVTPESTY